LKEDQLKQHLKEKYDLSLKVFRTRDEVIAKLSNEIARLKTEEYDMKKKFDKIMKSDNLTVKNKIQLLLTINDELSYEELKNNINVSEKWFDEVLKKLLKNKTIGYNSNTKRYYLIF